MNTSPKDQSALLWNAKRPAPRQARPGEPLFQFVDASDRALMACELRDHGEYGWEAQFLKHGELLYSRRFDTRGQAIQWSQVERAAFEKGAGD